MIFPVDEAVIPTEVESTNVGRSFAFDYKTKRFQMQDGAPVEISSLAAIKQWVELFTRTLPGKYAVHPDDLGTSCDLLIGGRYPASFAASEIRREIEQWVKDCPTVLSASGFKINRNVISFDVITTSGETGGISIEL